MAKSWLSPGVKVGVAPWRIMFIVSLLSGAHATCVPTVSSSLELRRALVDDSLDTICLAAGTYTFEGAMDSCDSALCIDRPVTLEAAVAVPGEEVILDGGGVRRVMKITGGTSESPVALVGLIITGGSAGQASARLLNSLDCSSSSPLKRYTTPLPWQGGGVAVWGNASFTTCTINDNYATAYVLLAF